MLYRFLDAGEPMEAGDEVYSDRGVWVRINVENGNPKSWMTRRPVQAPRPVEELTDEELLKINNFFMQTSSNYLTPDDKTDIIRALKLSDEIRARPRETEKEKWIKYNTPICLVPSDVIKDFERSLGRGL